MNAFNKPCSFLSDTSKLGSAHPNTGFSLAIARPFTFFLWGREKKVRVRFFFPSQCKEKIWLGETSLVWAVVGRKRSQL